MGRRRGDHNRLGFATQLGTVRFLGAFLSDPVDVPWAAVDYLTAQLGVSDSSVVKLSAEREKTHLEHYAWEIRDAYGYRDFADPAAAAGLREFMDGRAWTQAEGPARLFEQAAGWLRRNRVLLPGASVLARLTSTVREAAAERMHRTLAEAAALAAGAMLAPAAAGGSPASATASCFGTYSRTHIHWYAEPIKISSTQISPRTTRDVWVAVIPWPKPPYAKESPYVTLTCTS